MNDMSKLFKHAREALKFVYSSSVFFMYCFVRLLVSGLVLFTMYIKSPITVYSIF